MTPQQIDAIVTLAIRYRDACEATAALMREGSTRRSADHARDAAIKAKHAYDALVAQIRRVRLAD